MLKNVDPKQLVLKSIFISFLITFSFQIWAANLSPALACNEIFETTARMTLVSPNTPKRLLSDMTSLKLMTYNVENLVWSVGKFERTPVGLAPKFENQNGPQPKPEEKIEAIRKIIEAESPDVIVLEEVESIDALEHLAQKRLSSKYEAFLIPGNDERGLNIGYLVKTDLPFYVQHLTNKSIRFQDPVNDNSAAKLFSRDLPALLLRTSDKSDPFMIVFGNHAKSQRDRPGDPHSAVMRTIQYQMAALVIENYHQTYPNAIITLAGDYNADGNIAKELDPIRNIMPSAFELLKLPLSEQITQTFHPRVGPSVFSRLDDIRILKNFESQIVSVRVIPYKDQNGQPKPPAQTYAERSLQPSDHRPVIGEILLPHLQ